MLNRFLFLLLSLWLMGCSKSLPVDELEKYVQDEANGTKKVYETKGFKAELVCRPTDLILKQELAAGNTNISELRKNYENYAYFVLNMQNNGSDMLNSTVENKAIFAAINEQLSFGLQNHIYALNENNDTSYLADYAFPRLYETAHSTSVLIAFKTEKIKNNDSFKICLKDIAYTSGIIEFEFNNKDLKNIPALKL